MPVSKDLPGWHGRTGREFRVSGREKYSHTSGDSHLVMLPRYPQWIRPVS